MSGYGAAAPVYRNPGWPGVIPLPPGEKSPPPGGFTGHSGADPTDADLDVVVDDNWTPAVTMGVRLVSVLDDDAQHIGQAAYIRGLL
ncbi:hypothetical protein VX037_21660 [Gordonia sp. Z-3]|nr:hypothetical protein [Gordonia sp. Z-3]MED5803640.1 hypothetical protein [Gordonia sp. Z-3]